MHGTLPGITHAREEHPGAHRLTKARIDQSMAIRLYRTFCAGEPAPEPGHPARNRDTRPGTNVGRWAPC